ncbi:hypothetical protein ATCC90586_001135 [Pythium insidiosum]|nr:hypothetical protein ATCC90586_001135 [Pythium insidiosum]
MDALLRTELLLAETQRKQPHRIEAQRRLAQADRALSLRRHRSVLQEFGSLVDDEDSLFLGPPALLRRTSSSSSSDIRIPSFMIPSSASAMMNSRYALSAAPSSPRLKQPSNSLAQQSSVLTLSESLARSIVLQADRARANWDKRTADDA